MRVAEVVPHLGLPSRDQIVDRPYVASLWVAIQLSNFLRIGNRSFWESERPRGPPRPFQKVGGFAPHLSEGFPGPPGAAQTSKMTDVQSLKPSKMLNQALLLFFFFGMPLRFYTILTRLSRVSRGVSIKVD